MTAPARTLPIPAEHREFTVKVEGQAVGREQQLLAVSVVKTANRIAAARLAYLDGAASQSDFPLSNGDTFIPGKKIEIFAGAGDNPVSLFTGVVVRQGLKVRDHVAPQLIVECRHAAFKLALARKSACFLDQTDSDLIGKLLSDAGLSADVEKSSVKHAQQVQFRCTDWDFLLARAEASGKLVFTNDAKVAVRAPAFSAKPVCQLTFGATILELDAEIDARHQAAAVAAVSWDPAQQAVVETEAETPSYDAPGNLAASDLASGAGPRNERLVHGAIGADEARAWAGARWLRARLSKVSGRAKCEGIGTVSPGDLVTLNGAGKRYSGDVYLTGVRHEFDLVQGWKTHLQFGGVDPIVSEAADATAPRAAALVPAVSGLQIGIVVSNEDKDGEHRVRVKLPLVDQVEEGVWARVASLDAGPERGFFFRPEIGDEVVVGFLDDDPRHPVLLGMLHSSARAAPLKGSDDNHEKCYQSRSKLKLFFNDDQKVIRLETPAGNHLVLSEKDKQILLEDQNGNSIKLTNEGIQIESKTKLTLKAGTELSVESGTALKVHAGTELKLDGTAKAELSCAAITKLSGGMVQIN